MTENVNVKRVSRNAFQQAIEDKKVEGWKLKNESDNVAVMEKQGGWGRNCSPSHNIYFHLVDFRTLQPCIRPLQAWKRKSRIADKNRRPGKPGLILLTFISLILIPTFLKNVNLFQPSNPYLLNWL
jgi:hypothetical protein